MKKHILPILGFILFLILIFLDGERVNHISKIRNLQEEVERIKLSISKAQVKDHRHLEIYGGVNESKIK